MPAPPVTGVAKFGTSVVGRQFEWDAVSEDGTVTTIVARTVASIKFEDTIRYTTARQTQVMQVLQTAHDIKARLTDANMESPDFAGELEALVADRLKSSQERWASRIDVLLMLVREEDRDRLRPHLIAGDPRRVQELEKWLEAEVLGTVATDAAAAANVDPTLRPPPPNSASDQASGDDSDSTASTSTD